MTTSDSENLKDNPDLGSIFEESCKAEKSKEHLSKSSDKDKSERDEILNLTIAEQIIKRAEERGIDLSVGLRDYVDFIDNENPNDKGRDD